MSDETNASQPKVLITQLQHDATKPPAKPIVITLAWYIREYKVTSITNTTWYKPGHWMLPEVAQRLCDLPGWTVNTVDNDLLATVFGIGTGAVSKAITLPAI